MKFEIRTLNELLKNGEFPKMFYEAFGVAYNNSFSSASTEPQAEEVGLLYDNGVKVCFFSFKREANHVLIIDLGLLKAAAANRRYAYLFRIIEELHNIGFHDVGIEIITTTQHSIIDCLSLGFEIIGCRRAGRKLLLQLNHHNETNISTHVSFQAGTNFPTSGTMH